MAGHEQFVYPTKDLGGAGQFSGDYLESPDGTQLVLATANLGNKIVPRTDNSFVVMRNDGSIVRILAAPMPEATCSSVEGGGPPVCSWRAAPRNAVRHSSSGRCRSTVASRPH